MEPKAAVGLGVGYAFSRRWELWSETSRLQHLLLTPESSSGIRQILQMKYFPSQRTPNLFLAAEVRYKDYQYSRTGNFYNVSTNVYLNVPLTQHNRFWASALQAGVRQAIGKKSNLYVEATIGMGYRHMLFMRETGAPAGLQHFEGKSLDLESVDIYYPGSIRLVWAFGKKL